MGRPSISPEKRFWEKTDKNGPIPDHMDTPCWVWTGDKHGIGYGRLTSLNKQIVMHRFSYELHYGVIPEGLWVLHKCDNPACVRPDHLYLGTALDNARDRDTRGRSNTPKGNKHYARINPKPRSCGELNGQSKLTEIDVIYIREQWANRKTTGITQAKLAEEKNISRATVCLIVNRKYWRHLK